SRCWRCRGSAELCRTIGEARALEYPAQDVDRGAEAASRRADSASTTSTAEALKTVLKLGGGVRTVAERLVARLPAATQRDTVAHLVVKAVGAHDLPSAAHPDRARTTLDGIFDQANRRLVFGSIGSPVELSQATSRPDGQSQVWRTKS